MASSSPLPLTLLLFCFILFSLTSSSLAATAAEDGSVSLQIADDLKWPSAMSLLDEDQLEEEINGDDARRLLFWRRVKYYISYGAMSANRVPCPPRSGRSYYTHNCHIARGPAHPYSRGCSMITRCRR